MDDRYEGEGDVRRDEHEQVPSPLSACPQSLFTETIGRSDEQGGDDQDEQVECRVVQEGQEGGEGGTAASLAAVLGRGGRGRSRA